MNIDYNLYKIFLYLYKEKSISKTAAKLYVSQPAISYSLKELETQLGYQLFYRSSKGIEPTIEAKELYSYVEEAFNIFNDAEEHLKNLNNLNTGTIKIGISQNLGIFYLKDVINLFRDKYPKITFSFISSNTKEMLDLLEARKIDLIIDYLPVDIKKNMTKQVLSKLNNCFAYNKYYINQIDTTNINKNPLILPNTTQNIRKKLDEYLESKNIILNPIIEANNLDIILNSVRKGLGIGYFIEDYIKDQKDSNDFEITNFNYNLPSIDICCIYIESFLATAPSKFIETLKNNYN